MDMPLDSRERLELCALLDELGPSTPTLLEGWTTADLAAHIVLREHDLVAAPCLVLPGPFGRFAERRRVRLARRHDVRRANGGGPRSLDRELDEALWNNVRRASRYLSRRLRGPGLDVEWTGEGTSFAVRRGDQIARLR